jgi:hypothetical protein
MSWTDFDRLVFLQLSRNDHANGASLANNLTQAHEIHYVLNSMTKGCYVSVHPVSTLHKAAVTAQVSKYLNNILLCEIFCLEVLSLIRLR